MTFIYELDTYPVKRYSRRPIMNYLCRGFRKLSYYIHTDRCHQ